MPPCCWVDEFALIDLVNESSRFLLRETGGALLGWREDDQYVVSRVLGPGPAAKHSLRHFEPDGTWQAQHGRTIYAESGRTVAYLGDWHTHPHTPPVPSARDRETARDIAHDPSFRATSPLYAILGRSLTMILQREMWDLVIYVWDSDELVPANLEILRKTDAALEVRISAARTHWRHRLHCSPSIADRRLVFHRTRFLWTPNKAPEDGAGGGPSWDERWQRSRRTRRGGRLGERPML